MEKLTETRLSENISIRKLKRSFATKFPDSPLIPILASLPDQIEAEELISQSIILLKILDMERNKNLDFPKDIEEV